MADIDNLEKLAKLVRYYILRMTTKAGSGHPTSSLSATDIMTALFFRKLRFDVADPQNPVNDRVIFSKGHASPLLYALFAAAGELSERELDSYRQFKSPLEGHPTPNFKFADAATGSLGQGLSVGLGMALAMRTQGITGPVSGFPPASARSGLKSIGDKVDHADLRAVGGPSTTATRNSPARDTRDTFDTSDTFPQVFVLMGDSEVSEGSVWEAIELASFYKLGNLVGIIDVNRLGQSGETMLGWDTETYKKRIEAFDWQAHVVDGHNLREIVEVFESIKPVSEKPQMIIAKTVKGKGVSFLGNKEGWHGKTLSQEDCEKAVKDLGEVDREVRGQIDKPETTKPQTPNPKLQIQSPKLKTEYKAGEEVATRKAYGEALVKLGAQNPNVVVLDAEVKNSTFSEMFKEKFPDRFFEMFIAEQNMVGAALGLSKRGLIPFVSTFATFFTRAFDQIRMTAYSRGNIKFMGSHAGVSIGEDGPSQMGLEDMALFRSVFGSVVLNPSDAVSCEKLVFEAAKHEGIVYIRTARPATPVIYENSEDFKIGGSKVVKSSSNDRATIVACGVALVEVLKVADELEKKEIKVRVIDAYSVKPVDGVALKKAAKETKAIVTVEDHYPQGGLGDAVLDALSKEKVAVYKLAVSKMPMSGKPQELLDYEGISEKAIVKKVLEICS